MRVTILGRKSLEIDKKKMQHALQMKMLAKETKEIKVKKFKQFNVLRNKTNKMDHKRKPATIEFVATTRQKGKEEDVCQKEKAKQGKLQIGAEQMGVLHGQLHKQVASNGGTVPNLGTTPLPMVSSS